MGIPTKKELMQKMVSVHGKNVFTSSLKYSDEFGFNHRDTLEKIRNLTAEHSAVRFWFKEKDFLNNRGRKYQYFEMTRDGYMFLIMQMGNAKSKESINRIAKKQQEFIKAFNLMEDIISQQKNTEWMASRSQGKVARKSETDTIKMFIEYAIKQGSTSANHYYSNITKASYKALGLMEQNRPKTRDTLNMLQTHQLLVAEEGISKLIHSAMLAGMHYKDIYQECKQWLKRFAEHSTYHGELECIDAELLP